MTSKAPPSYCAVYLYDPTSFEYAGTQNAQLSPIDDHTTQDGAIYLWPLHCCLDAPPLLAVNEAAVFTPAAAPKTTRDGTWVVHPDFRGHISYNQVDGSTQVVSAIGPLPPNFALTPPPPTVTSQLAMLASSVQQHLDDTAKVKSYDNAASCISYLASSNTTWKADAAAMTAWRDAVWTFCLSNEVKVLNGAIPVPSAAQLLSMLPAAPW